MKLHIDHRLLAKAHTETIEKDFLDQKTVTSVSSVANFVFLNGGKIDDE
jgi:hypothetical protein